MNQPVSAVAAKDIPFTDADFRQLAGLARAQFGLSLSDSKKPLVYSRLSRRLKARNIPSFPEYLALISSPNENDERLELISALTTNVTSFFRENHHFDTLRQDCLPGLIARAKQGGRVRIWSAGCSSGQEPYSIAATLIDAFPDAPRHNVKILATDIDPQIVRKAKAGQYPKDEKNGMAPNIEKLLFENSDGKTEGLVVRDIIKRLVTFAELNLISDWPFKGPFDVIFCRNVAIYFDQETQQRLWKRFADYLNTGGYLFIGHSERVTGDASQCLQGVGITSYRKV